MNKQRIIVIIIIISIILIFGSLGIILATKFNNTKTITNGIILENSGKEYKSKLITTYEEYDSILKEYSIKDVVLFTNNDFKDNDYIVDFLDYDGKTTILDIDVTIENDGLNIVYTTSKKMEEPDKKLMYFIKIDKNMLKEVNVKSRSIEVK